MNFSKHFAAVLALVVMCLGSNVAQTADYPSKPISLVCAFGAGTGADLIIRPVLPYIKEALGLEVVMDYKSGAAGIVGANYYMTKKPDGYNLLFYNQPHIMLQEMFMETAYKTADIEPLLGLSNRPDFLIVRTDDARFKKAEDVFAYAKANPKKLSIGTVGEYSGNHLTYCQLENATGLQITRVPFENGGKMLAALLGGQVDAILSSYMWTDTYKGKIVALCSATEKRFVENVPTFAECGIEGVAGATQSNFIFVNKKTPPEFVKVLRERLSTVASNPKALEDMRAANMKYDAALYNWQECEALMDNIRAQIKKVEPLLRAAAQK